MKNFIQRGETVPVIAPYDVKSGDGVLVGSLFGVACHDALAGAPLEMDMGGVFALSKTAAQAWTLGAKVYWDDTNRRVTTATSGTSLIGAALEAAPNPSSVGKVRLDGVTV